MIFREDYQKHLREKERGNIDSLGWFLSFSTEISLRMKSPATVGFEQCLPSSTWNFFNYRSCLAARIDSYASHTKSWGEEARFQFGIGEMKQMDLSSLHRAPRSQHGLQIFTFASQKRREKKKNKSSKSDTNWYDVEGQSVGVLCFIFSSSIKVSIISSRLVQLHILLQFHFLNMGSAFYKRCFYVWKEKSFPPSSWWFHFLYSRRQRSLLTQHSKKKKNHTL